MEDTDKRLSAVCSTLGLSDAFCNQSLLNDIWAIVTSEQVTSHQKDLETKYRLGICLLYTSCVDARFPYGTDDPSSSELCFNFSVSQLLEAAELNIIDFFKSMRLLRDLHPVSQAVLSHLLALEKKFLISSPLYQKFVRMTEDIFQSEEKSGTTIDMNRQSNLEEKELCWHLFVYAKEVCMPGQREILESFRLLLCCIDSVLQITPAFQLKPPFDSAKLEVSENPTHSRLLETLCSTYHTQEHISKVLKFKVACLDPLIKSLLQENAFDRDSIAERYYVLYKMAGDIDELFFLKKVSHLSVTGLATDRDTQSSKEEGKRSKPVMPCTPIRAAMNAVQSLNAILTDCDVTPSSTLSAIFKNCSVDPSTILAARVSTMQHTFTERYCQTLEQRANVLSQSRTVQRKTAEERVNTATRLFYKQLETLLKMEEEKLSQKDFSHLLNNTTFPVCLLACSIQVVLATYAQNLTSSVQRSPGNDVTDPLGFPWILDTFEIQAFDFFKVIESFLRAERNLPQPIKSHLHTLENRVVEQLAWKKGSPLLAAIERCHVMLPTIPQTPPPGSLPVVIPEVKAAISSAPHLYLSPMRPHGNIQAPVTPTRDVTVVGETAGKPRDVTGESAEKPLCKSHSLSVFLNRVCKLAYQRLLSLCGLLEISRDMRQKIWTCVEYCVTKRSELMVNRHLDQVLMCCIYAISKITDKEIKFKNIVAAYRHLPHSAQQVYKHIEICAGEHDSIINFYNRVFMQKLKAYLVQFSTTPAPKVVPLTHSPLPRAPVSPCTRQLQASPIVTLPGRSNFFISPLIDSPFKVPMSPGQLTPRSKQTFSFGDGPGSSEKLKAINAALKSPPSGGPRSHKRLKFDHSQPGSPQNEGIVQFRRVQFNSPAAKSLDFSKAPDA